MQQPFIPKRAAIYAHVAATQHPESSSSCLEEQINECQAYAEKRGYTLQCVYQETAAGAKRDRPMLNALRQAIQDHQFEVLIVQDLTRLARGPALLATILLECYEAGITIESVRDNWKVYRMTSTKTTKIERQSS
jgi:DNA invertase Pin-like site-specific DNA recombinase